MLNFIPVVSTTVYINPTVQLPSFYIHFSLFPPLSLPLLLYFSYQLYSLYPSRYYPLVRTLFFLLLQLFLSNSSHSTAYYLSPASFSITFILSSSQSFFLTLFLLLLQLFLSNSSHSTAYCLSLLLSLFLSFFRSSVFFSLSFAPQSYSIFLSFFFYTSFSLSLSLSILPSSIFRESFERLFWRRTPSFSLSAFDIVFNFSQLKTNFLSRNGTNFAGGKISPISQSRPPKLKL